jgi:hypothetical protein
MGLTEDEIFGLFDITARPRRGGSSAADECRN